MHPAGTIRFHSPCRWTIVLLLAALQGVPVLALPTPQTSAQQSPAGTFITGLVLDADGRPVSGASVTLNTPQAAQPQHTTTDASGRFSFAHLQYSSYTVVAQTSAARSSTVDVPATSPQALPLKLILQSASRPSLQPEFSDNPDFTIAGVVDWTAVGGHGSDATLRTSEDLARETLTLKSPDPHTPSANTPAAATNTREALDHRQAAAAAEKAGDPLAAVQQLERAAALNPTEDNFFAWGSDLLLHRAVWEAAQVFGNAAKAYPNSARVKTAWGSALFAAARYDEAAHKLCESSDLNPADPETIRVMGKAELASPTPLPCVEQRLAAFQSLQPDSDEAAYLQAMVLTRQDPTHNHTRIEALLTQAVTLNPKHAEAYLQLGKLAAAAHHNPEAIAFYQSAIAADPQLAEAHYRLAVAYDRTGNKAASAQELQLHDRIEKAQADAVEQQRREIKQFVVLSHPPPTP